jgi:hypothetical protein
VLVVSGSVGEVFGQSGVACAIASHADGSPTARPSFLEWGIPENAPTRARELTLLIDGEPSFVGEILTNPCYFSDPITIADYIRNVDDTVNSRRRLHLQRKAQERTPTSPLGPGTPSAEVEQWAARWGGGP